MVIREIRRQIWSTSLPVACFRPAMPISSGFAGNEHKLSPSLILWRKQRWRKQSKIYPEDKENNIHKRRLFDLPLMWNDPVWHRYIASCEQSSGNLSRQPFQNVTQPPFFSSSSSIISDELDFNLFWGMAFKSWIDNSWTWAARTFTAACLTAVSKIHYCLAFTRRFYTYYHLNHLMNKDSQMSSFLFD